VNMRVRHLVVWRDTCAYISERIISEQVSFTEAVKLSIDKGVPFLNDVAIITATRILVLLLQTFTSRVFLNNSLLLFCFRCRPLLH